MGGYENNNSGWGRSAGTAGYAIQDTQPFSNTGFDLIAGLPTAPEMAPMYPDGIYFSGFETTLPAVTGFNFAARHLTHNVLECIRVLGWTCGFPRRDGIQDAVRDMRSRLSLVVRRAEYMSDSDLIKSAERRGAEEVTYRRKENKRTPPPTRSAQTPFHFPPGGLAHKHTMCAGALRNADHKRACAPCAAGPGEGMSGGKRKEDLGGIERWEGGGGRGREGEGGKQFEGRNETDEKRIKGYDAPSPLDAQAENLCEVSRHDSGSERRRTRARILGGKICEETRGPREGRTRASHAHGCRPPPKQRESGALDSQSPPLRASAVKTHIPTRRPGPTSAHTLRASSPEKLAADENERKVERREEGRQGGGKEGERNDGGVIRRMPGQGGENGKTKRKDERPRSLPVHARDREPTLEEKLEERDRELRELCRRAMSDSADALLADRNAELEDELDNMRGLLEDNMYEIQRLCDIVERHNPNEPDADRVAALEAANVDFQACADEQTELAAQRKEDKEDLAHMVEQLRLENEDLQQQLQCAEAFERSEMCEKLMTTAVLIDFPAQGGRTRDEACNLVTNHERVVTVVEEEWRGEVEETGGQFEELRDKGALKSGIPMINLPSLNAYVVQKVLSIFKTRKEVYPRVRKEGS
ncbi:hypothetical protein B0H17DRAFT_1223883 [Mycena rosella]|uniref:Uncharacterized protein n=1 Tax=Mycena rosella TaxID=1033263 RepID=A0AAD7H2K8_MYCRO|nr:hypothetical protein B0H17DRAFT_1223883 [Mycena rosella]